MKVGRKKLRQIILEVLCEGEIIYPNFPDHRDDTDEKWDDLLDPDEYEELRSLRSQLRMLRGKEDQILRDIMSQTKEDDKKYPEDDEEFERYLAGIKSSKSGKSGQLIDLFDDYDDDDLSEAQDSQKQTGDKAHAATLGIGVSTGDKDATRQDIEAEIQNTVAQINAIPAADPNLPPDEQTASQQKKKALNLQHDVLQKKLSSM